MSFEKLGLQAELLRAVSAQGYTRPTPIQARAIPMVLAGRDVLAGAQTGTGKTAAFALPMLQLLSRRGANGREPRALILTPTRELAAQVEESMRTYGKGLRLRSTVIYGGVGLHPQIQHLRRGVDILVATPGRLLDLANRGNLNLSRVEILVLDEGDRMLDMGFMPDIRRIMALLPRKRQNMLFSATYSDQIRDLAGDFLHQPEMIDVAPRNAAVDTVSHVVHPVARAAKRALLTKLILDGDWRQVLVFTRTKHGANRLATQLLDDGVSATAIHGNKSQGARTRALTDFKRGIVRVLVATDLASRGLDIEQLPHVVNYELPNVPEDYIHRIGRTGRAGANGIAVSLVCAEELGFLRDIQRLLKREIEIEKIPGFKVDIPRTAPTRRHAAPQARAPKRPAQDSNRTDSRRRPPRRRRSKTRSSRP